MTGITAERLRRERNVQWPCLDLDDPGTKRRYLDQVFPTANGRANLIPHALQPPKEPADREFPLVLTTGRIYAHWHTLTRTGKVDKLLKRNPEPYVEIHPADAARLQITDGQLVTIQSRRGTVFLPVEISTAVRPGLLFAPFHWGDLWGPDRAVNYLTIAALDATSNQPELKYCAVAVEPAATGPAAASHPDGLELPRAAGGMFRWIHRDRATATTR
jgi:ferredoxin-nitrate reductase